MALMQTRWGRGGKDRESSKVMAEKNLSWQKHKRRETSQTTHVPKQNNLDSVSPTCQQCKTHVAQGHWQEPRVLKNCEVSSNWRELRFGGKEIEPLFIRYIIVKTERILKNLHPPLHKRQAERRTKEGRANLSSYTKAATTDCISFKQSQFDHL